MQDIEIEWINEIPHIHPKDVEKLTDQLKVIDVRTPEEYHGELGHMKNAKLVPMGEELEKYLNELKPEDKVLFVCRSGARSGKATQYCQENLNLKQTYNMFGGMLLWNDLAYPVEK